MEKAAHAGFGSRRADVDSLRVIALALLIVYHVLLIFAGNETWRVTSTHSGWWADYLIGALTPWRMSAVFFIAGVAMRFMLSRSSYGEFVKERAARLLVAFAFAVVVLVPPQRFVQLDSLGEVPNHSYLFYLTHEAPFATSYLGLHLPQFAHAWFLPYLFAYSAIIAALWYFAPKVVQRMQAAVEATPIWAIIMAVIGWFLFVEVGILKDHPYNRMFLNDFSAHSKFVPVFMLGMLVGKSEVFWTGLLRWKWPLWALAATLLAASTLMKALYLREMVDETSWVAAQALFGGAMLLSVVTFAHWALNRPSRMLTYMSDAILPVYLLHQTVLVVVGDKIVRQHWSVVPEFLALFAVATVLPIAIYHVLIRPTPWLRFLFGLRPQARVHPPGAQQHVEAVAAIPPAADASLRHTS